jgi:hypothetical protein
MKRIILLLLLSVPAFAAEPAKVSVAADESAVVTVQSVPSTQPASAASAPASAEVTIRPSPWAPLRDALIAAIVTVIGAGVPVLIVWLRSLGKRITEANAKATDGLVAGQAAHSVAEAAGRTANQALAASPPPLAGGRRTGDPPPTASMFPPRTNDPGKPFGQP